MTRLLSGRRTSRLRAVAIAALPLLATTANADTIRVSPLGHAGHHSSIQRALDVSAEGDTILVAAGTFRENVVMPPGRVLIGSWNADFSESDVDLYRTTIDADSAGPCLLAEWDEPDPVAVVAGLHLTGGSGVIIPGGPIWEQYGGGIYARGLREIRDCVIEDNVAAFGGGILVYSDTLRLERVRFVDNRIEFLWMAGLEASPPAREERGRSSWVRKQGAGALVDVTGDLVIEDCQFLHNGTWISGCDGMGVYATARWISVNGCVFRSNYMDFGSDSSTCDGGGIYASCDTLIVHDSLFEANRLIGGDTGGGAISSWNALVRLVRCDFLENRSGLGGAILCSQLELEDCTFRDNVANAGDGSGGGGAVFTTEMRATNCAFTSNEGGGSMGGAGGAIYAQTAILDRCLIAGNYCTAWFNPKGAGAAIYTRVEARNSIFSGNSYPMVSGKGAGLYVAPGATGTVTNCAFTWNHLGPSGEGTAIWGAVESRYTLLHGNGGTPCFGEVDSVGHVHGDPLFRAPGDYRLKLHSPAIDAGDPAILDPDGSRSDIGLYGGPDGGLARPPRVAGLALAAKPDGARLTWDPVIIPGLAGYAVYGSDQAGFAPGLGTFLGVAYSPEFVHAFPAGETRYYRVSAFDLAGLGGGYSEEADTQSRVPLDALTEGAPSAPMFGRPFPNPARGPVSFPVSLPVAGPVRMEIHDVTGRLIASSSSPLAAGVGVLSWDGRDTRDRTVSSGIYLVSIAAAGESRSFRVLRVR